jgi:hypothetical protein
MQNHVSLRRLRRLALLPALALASACENSVSITPDVLAGNYTATSFVVTQTGQPSVDVLARGGSLTINIAANDSITGLLVVPSGVPGSQAGTADMKGRVVRRSDGSYQFDQDENTFVEALVWQQFTDALVSTSFFVTTQFQVTLRK